MVPLLTMCLLWQYMERCLYAGENLEFFLEGSRSRSGKPCSPKAGLLSVVVDAVKQGEPQRWQLLRLLSLFLTRCVCRGSGRCAAGASEHIL